MPTSHIKNSRNIAETEVNECIKKSMLNRKVTAQNHFQPVTIFQDKAKSYKFPLS